MTELKWSSPTFIDRQLDRSNPECALLFPMAHHLSSCRCLLFLHHAAAVLPLLLIAKWKKTENLFKNLSYNDTDCNPFPVTSNILGWNWSTRDCYINANYFIEKTYSNHLLDKKIQDHTKFKHLTGPRFEVAILFHSLQKKQRTTYNC